MMVIGLDAEFGPPLKFDHLLPSPRFDVGSLLEIFALQKWECLLLWPWPEFSRSPLQELDGQMPCDHFVENLMKIGWMVSEIFNVFFCFPGHTFFTWKMETKSYGNLRSCRTFFVELEYLHHNPCTNSRIDWTVYEKTDYMRFPLHLRGKAGKGSKVVGKKDKRVLSSAHRIEGPLEFCDYL